jgi:hypothetical protein
MTFVKMVAILQLLITHVTVALHVSELNKFLPITLQLNHLQHANPNTRLTFIIHHQLGPNSSWSTRPIRQHLLSMENLATVQYLKTNCQPSSRLIASRKHSPYRNLNLPSSLDSIPVHWRRAGDKWERWVIRRYTTRYKVDLRIFTVGFKIQSALNYHRN